MSMKNSNDTIGNRTSDLPTCSAVPQPTAGGMIMTVGKSNYSDENPVVRKEGREMMVGKPEETRLFGKTYA